MTQASKERLAIDAAADLPDPIGVLLWQLEDGRRETLKALQDISVFELDWESPHFLNGIATLLYHIAAVEADWLYVEVLQTDFSPVERWLPYPMRDASGRLMPVKGESLDDLVTRLDAVRSLLLAAFTTMSLEDFRRPRELERYDVTPEWVLHHLLLHEAEHRGEITMLRTLAQAQR